MVPPKGSDTSRAVTGPRVTGLESVFSSMRMDEALDEYVQRPGTGTAGKVIPVFANMYQARFKNQGKESNTIYHYDVEINPVVKVANQKKPRALLWEVWNQLCRDANGDVKKVLDASAYDMVKNMYTPHSLPIGDSGKIHFTVSLKEEGVEGDDRRRFKVEFALANEIDMNTIAEFCRGERQSQLTKETMLVAVQAMNILFRQDPTHKYKAIGAQGRRFFSTGSNTHCTGGMVYNGFVQSFRWTASGLPAIQLDTAYSAFVQTGNLVDVAAALLGLRGDGGGGGFRGGRPDRGGRGRGGGLGAGGPPGAVLQQLNPGQVRKLNDILRMAKFSVTHRKTSRIFTMRGITSQPASELKFLLNGKDGRADRMVSVVQYMKDQYNYEVRKPRLPCVQYGAKFYLPMECVMIKDFNTIPMRALAADQTAEMIKISAKNPGDRQEMITQWRQTLGYQDLPKVRAWGVEVQSALMKFNARVLMPPDVMYGGNKVMKPRFGAWNLKGVKFTRPGQRLKSWAILSFDRRIGNPQMAQFVDQLVGVLKASACAVDNLRPSLIQQDPASPDGEYGGIKPAMQRAARAAYDQSKANPQLVVVILPRKDAQMYKIVKQIGAEGLHKPVVTQCLQANKVVQERGMEQYLGNVSMKIHAKMGGVTHEVVLPPKSIDKKTMIIGADVSHPPPKGGPIPPSIAVTVASTSGDNVRFVPALRLQEGRMEIIKDLADMVASHLLTFQANTKSLPEKIIMFRDGVSEGQYAHCVNEELQSIKKAAFKVAPNYKPKITFVICAKRHNMRFFAANDQDKDKTGNLPAGTVVDTGVVHPFAFDFYLQAHAGLQGTAKPTHYIVVADENGFTADSMQTLCNSLCYSYARATRAVSLVPVAYYADLIAGKARDFVYDEDNSDAATIVSSNSGTRQNATFDPLRLTKRIESEIAFNSVAWYM